MTINMWIATLAWLLLLAGFANRKARNRHVPLMLSGITIDLSLVLYLQFTRNAVQTAANFTLGLMPQMHIGVSLVATLLYLPVLYLGSRLVRGTANAKQRALHVRLAITALIFRTLGFFFMFSMWK